MGEPKREEEEEEEGERLSTTSGGWKWAQGPKKALFAAASPIFIRSKEDAGIAAELSF